MGSGVKFASCTNRLGAVMDVGDVNADGRPDFIFSAVSDLLGGTVSNATLFINTGTTGGAPVFSQIDLSQMLINDAIAWHMPGNQLAFTDYNGDGRQDLMALSSGATQRPCAGVFEHHPVLPSLVGPGIVLLTDAGLATPVSTETAPSPVGYGCMPTLGISIGGTFVAPGDYNGDGTIDIIVGSASEKRLTYYPTKQRWLPVAFNRYCA